MNLRKYSCHFYGLSQKVIKYTDKIFLIKYTMENVPDKGGTF